MSNERRPLQIKVSWSPEGYDLSDDGADSAVVLRLYQEGEKQHITGVQVAGTRDPSTPMVSMSPVELYRTWICFTGLVARDMPAGKEKFFVETVLSNLQLDANLNRLSASEEGSRPEVSSLESPLSPAGEPDA